MASSPPKWHPIELPLHISVPNYGADRHLYVEGYWSSVSSDPGQQSATDANTVKLTCDYGDKSIGEAANACTETEGYAQFGSIHTDTQTYHVASWSPDEVIATDSEQGLSGTTATTLIIHPQANEIEIIDRTKMDEKQPALTKGLEGKSFGDHFELHGGMYALGTLNVLFQCDQEGIVTEMRLDVAQAHKGDVYSLKEDEWNSGSKSTKKYTSEECATAMKKKLEELH